ncbi:MAG: hypothetical protein L3J09_07480 [Flavobacteriaceae bacterium]|nr:hypothetical protein [Flavobacteriaceae bacterium]
MKTLLKYDFCEIEVYNDYIIAIMNEGISLTPDKNDVLLGISSKYFKNKDFGYITHRINSYSVDPRIYTETSKIENLVSFAVVSNNKLALSNAQIEKLFYKKPFKQFINLEDAISWIKKHVIN